MSGIPEWTLGAPAVLASPTFEALQLSEVTIRFPADAPLGVELVFRRVTAAGVTVSTPVHLALAEAEGGPSLNDFLLDLLTWLGRVPAVQKLLPGPATQRLAGLRLPAPTPAGPAPPGVRLG